MKDQHTSHPRGFGLITYANTFAVDDIVLKETPEAHVINGKQQQGKQHLSLVTRIASPMAVSGGGGSSGEAKSDSTSIFSVSFAVDWFELSGRAFVFQKETVVLDPEAVL
ncbi:hypothetical protein Nepgr_009857 [Nepenthes gracilis]|uniref:Uncharacterized protein n=1 Tax=Nepenthes gracilis TaxID=150966 RepID=A0AAD3SBI6_NEPGR|nr:hypothetical protein Nepgr_009857 [Nepenthes gracilis]